MEKTDIVEWFDPYNYVHIQAYLYYQKHDAWPIGFLVEGISFSKDWKHNLLKKMTCEWIKHITTEYRVAGLTSQTFKQV